MEIHQPFQIGEEYSCLKDFLQAKSNYEKEKFFVMVKVNSEKWPPGHKYAETIVYKKLIYECKKGKNYHSSKSCGIRKNITTGKLGCCFQLKLRARSGNLVVKACNLTHTNHKLSENCYNHIPETLRLDDNELKEAELVLKTGGNKKKLQVHLVEQRGGRPVILKQLHNIASKLQYPILKSCGTDLEKLLDEMKILPDVDIYIAYSNDDKELIGIYFQDKRMKYTFEKFPELLIFDATYKLNNYKMPLFILLAVDGNGESEVICIWIVPSENKFSVGTMIDYFKCKNSAWEKIQVFIGDKDFADRAIFYEKFPNAKINICLFHVLKSFKRELLKKLAGLTHENKQQILEIFSDLAYSANEEEYNLNFNKLLSMNLSAVTEYFVKNWHNIKEEWVLYLRNKQLTFLNNTTNRLESLNQKLKSVITRYSNLSKCFKDLLICLSSIAIEHDHKVITASEKLPIYPDSRDTNELEIRKELTNFAAEHVIKEYRASRLINFTVLKETCAIFLERNNTISTTFDSCTCRFATTMGLPCRHILEFRNQKNIKIFSIEICLKRWTKEYYYNQHPVFIFPKSDLHQNSEILHSKKVKSECEKYSESNKIMNDISSTLSTLSNEKFTYYSEKLREFKKFLVAGQPLILQECIESKPSTLPTVKLSEVKMPPKIKKKGNLKGFGQKVIGLNRKKRKAK